jgi:hypothetical protein
VNAAKASCDFRTAESAMRGAITSRGELSAGAEKCDFVRRIDRDKDVLDLRRIEVERTKADRWNGQLPQNVYAGAPMPFMQVR